MSDASLKIRLFGPFSAMVTGEPLPPLRTRKGQWLLALLALRQGREVSREWLAGTLWPDSTQSQAYYNLRQCLTNLRHALGAAADCLQAPTSQTLCLASETVWCDVRAFDVLVAEGVSSALERAVVLYRGPLMEGCSEDCFLLERAVREQAYHAALETLADYASACGEPASAVRYLRRLLAADPYREAACGALMEAFAACGDYAAATEAYRELRLRLHRELNAFPTPELDALHRRLIEQSKQPALHGALAKPEYELPLRHLPVPLTRLIGREREVEEVVACLKTDRLVTLIGAGGVGKTRLALAVGEALTKTYTDGVWFIELAALTEAERLPQTVAKLLGVSEQAGRPVLVALTDALVSRSILILLDNAEHVLEACARLSERLLAFCPGVHLLVTSRQPFGLMGEKRYRVPSLPLPPAKTLQDGSETTEVLMHYAGVRLFVERAEQWRPGFALTQKNAKPILHICHRLDGIPLAIELAAARVRSFSVEEIDTHLQDQFALLTGGNRTALPRHQTLHALIDWSYDLLTAAEQSLLRQLSVFAGGWTLSQAQKICMEWAESKGRRDESAPDSQPIPFDAALSILDGLTSLVDKSLVLAETEEGGTRYRMLETVRQYAQEKLRATEEWEAVSRRHCDCFLALAEEADTPENSAKQGYWLDVLEKEYDNLRAALAWCREEPEEVEKETRLIAALYTFWHLRGYLREGRDYLLSAAEKTARCGDLSLQAQLLLRAGALARLQGDFTDAESVLMQSLIRAKTVGATSIEATALLLLGSIALTQRGDAEAVAMIEHALTVARRSGYLGVQSECLVWLGDAARWRGDYAAAQGFYEAGLEAARPLNMGWFEACALGMMAELALLQGEIEKASDLGRRALQGYAEVGDKTYCLLLLDTVAGIAQAQSEFEAAARILAFVDALTQAMQAPLPLPEQKRHRQHLAGVQVALNTEAFRAAYATGYTMRWEEGLLCALKVTQNNTSCRIFRENEF